MEHTHTSANKNKKKKRAKASKEKRVLGKIRAVEETLRKGTPTVNFP